MTQQPQLTEEQWDLIAELLVNERQDLPSEIHHSDTPEVRRELKKRLRLVEGVLEKINHREKTGVV